MRIKSITVRNYRVHRDQKIQLDDSRTLIGGPNECGKSTLVEAVHRALFLKSKVTGDVHRSMVSTCFAGMPEVELVFTVGNADYILTKRFGGKSGTTRLVQVGGETWLGDEAETRLATLLKVEPLGGGHGVAVRLAQQWSHLWVVQGQSGGDPAEHANLQKDGLLQRLQQIGGAAALQSDLDARVAGKFATAREEIFTQAGKAKTGSELERAETEAARAETNRQRASERVEKLRDAVQDLEAANETIACKKVLLQTLAEQRKAVETKLFRVEELRCQEANQQPLADIAANSYRLLKNGDDQISQLRLKIANFESSLEPQNAESNHLSESLGSAQEQAATSEGNYERANLALRGLRQRRDLAAAWVSRFEKAEQLQELSIRDGLVRGHQELLIRFRHESAKLPEITASKLPKLQRLETEFNHAEAGLNAMAAGIEIISSSEPVRVGEQTLQVGESRIVAELTEVIIGSSSHLRINPGGGSSLGGARRRAQETRAALQKALDEIGVATVADAVEVATHRNELSGKIENAEAALEGLRAANLPELLCEARKADAAAQGDVERRSAHVPDFAPPAGLVNAKKSLLQEESASEHAESTEADLKKQRDAAAKSLEEARQAITDHQNAVSKQMADLNGMRGQLHLLLHTYGEDVPRGAALADALSAKKAAEVALTTTQNALAELRPDLLEGDRGRLTRARVLAEEAKNDADAKRAVAQASLVSDGTDDPEAALALATAQARSAQSHQVSVRRKAEGIRLLNQLFLDEQRTLADQFTQPFAERISAYLQCLFGAGARAMVTLVDNAFTGLQLVRPTQGGGAVAFDQLSGGAREQVAAAVRLAMAEVLAADHDGCLPVVFDDAFAYSDPERVQILQRMLDLAASRGLQLMILTCNPSDYAGLGAHEIKLRLERVVPITPPMIVPEPPDGSNGGNGGGGQVVVLEPEMPAVLVPVSDEHRNLLLARLQEAGGRAGNVSLRETLGWDETTYTTVKKGLIATGQLVSGRGRGGSVALPGAEKLS